MLSARRLSISRGKQMVLRDIDLSLVPGELLGVLGPNGAGKSTLLNLLSGELTPDTGEVLLDERLLADWSGIQRARRLAVLPQSSTLSFAFPVAEVVGMGRMPHATGQLYDAQVVAEVLQATDAAHLAERSYLQLSGGERQRVHLARVLAQLWPGGSGQTLLLDEPTSMLDPLHQHSTLQAVRRFAEQGGAAMVILHDLNLAARYCDRLLLLNAGTVHACGRPDQVLRAEPLQQVFGLEVLIQRHPERGHPLIVTR